MKSRVLLAVLSCLVMPLVQFPKEPASMRPQHENLTLDRALAALRSRASRPGTSFQVAREITSNSKPEEVAQRSLEEASSRQIHLYNQGILLALLRTGGFLVLEIDSTTGNAITLLLISSASDGQPIIDSHEIEGSVSGVLAKAMIENTTDFVDALLSEPPSEVSKLENKFYSGRFPQYSRFEDQSFFAIPSVVAKLNSDMSEDRELAALVGAYHIWPIRYALSMLIYPANPASALRMAHEKQQTLVEQFMRKNNKNSDFIYDLQNLESIHNPVQLRERILWFRQLDNSLEDGFQKNYVPSIFDDNKLLSTIAIELGSTATGTENAFSVLTSPALIVNWKQLAGDSFAVISVSSADEGEPRDK
jgi:hypothetical protein